MNQQRGLGSLVLRGVALGALIGACFGLVWQAQAQDSAAEYNARGIERYKRGEYDRAISDFNQAISLNPNDAAAYSNRGDVKIDENEYDQAIIDCNQAIRLNPKYTLAYINRSRAWNGKNEYDRAIADCNQAIKLDPNSTLAYINRSLAWCGKREYDRAIADCNQAIKFDPNCALAYVNRSLAWGGKREYDRAIGDCDEAIRLDPNNTLAYFNRGGAWYAKRKYQRVIEDYNEAIKLNHYYPGVYARLAWLQATCPDARFRDGQTAFENANRAYQLDGGKDTEILEVLAAACAEKGDFEVARKWQAKAIELSTNEKQKQERRSRLKLYERGKPCHQEPRPR